MDFKKLSEKLKKGNMLVLYHSEGCDYLFKDDYSGNWKIKSFMGKMYLDNNGLAKMLNTWIDEGEIEAYEVKV